MEEKKICNRCQKTKVIDEFNWKNRKKGTRQGECRTCKAKFQKAWYEKNRKIHMQNVNRNKKLKIHIAKEKLCEYLKEHPCVDCSEPDIVVLQFDHKDDVVKTDNICAMVATGYIWETILEEIEKCEVRRANCHARRTAKQFGFYKISKRGVTEKHINLLS